MLEELGARISTKNEGVKEKYSWNPYFTSSLINFVNKGKLTHLRANLNVVVKIATSCLEELMDSENILKEKNLLQIVIRILDSRYPKIFSNLDSHVDLSRKLKIFLQP